MKLSSLLFSSLSFVTMIVNGNAHLFSPLMTNARVTSDERQSRANRTSCSRSAAAKRTRRQTSAQPTCWAPRRDRHRERKTEKRWRAKKQTHPIDTISARLSNSTNPPPTARTRNRKIIRERRRHGSLQAPNRTTMTTETTGTRRGPTTRAKNCAAR